MQNIFIQIPLTRISIEELTKQLIDINYDKIDKPNLSIKTFQNNYLIEGLLTDEQAEILNKSLIEKGYIYKGHFPIS